MKVIFCLLFVFSFSAYGHTYYAICMAELKKDIYKEIEPSGVGVGKNFGVAEILMDDLTRARSVQNAREYFRSPRTEEDTPEAREKNCEAFEKSESVERVEDSSEKKVGNTVVNEKKEEAQATVAQNEVEAEIKRNSKRKEKNKDQGHSREISGNKVECVTAAFFNSDYGNSCSDLPSNFGYKDGEPTQLVFSLMERFNLVHSKDVLNLGGDSKGCDKCLSKNISGNGPEKLNSAFDEVVDQLSSKIIERNIDTNLHKLVDKIESLEDFYAVRGKALGDPRENYKCGTVTEIENKVKSKCESSGVSIETAQARLATSMKSVGLRLGDTDNAFKKIFTSIDSTTRNIEKKYCESGSVSRDAEQAYAMNSLYKSRVGQIATKSQLSLDAISDFFQNSAEESRKYCNENVINAYPPGDFYRKSVVSKNDQEKLEAETKRGLDIINVKDGDPLLRILLEDKDEFCKFTNNFSSNKSFASMLVLNEDESFDEFKKKNLEVSKAYASTCTDVIEEFTDALCDAPKDMQKLAGSYTHVQLKDILEEEIDSIHEKEKEISDKSKAKILSMGKISCILSEGDDGAGFKPIGIKENFLYSGKSVGSSLVMLDLASKGLIQEDYQNLINSENPKDAAYCSDQFEGIRQAVASGVFGIPADQTLMDEVNLQYSQDYNEPTTIFSRNIAKKLASGQSVSSILSEMKAKRENISRGVASSSKIEPITNKTAVSEIQNILKPEQNLPQAYTDSSTFMKEIKQLDQEEKLIDDLVSGNSEVDQLEKALTKDKSKEQDKLDELNKQLAELEKKITEAKKAEQLRKAGELEDQKKKIKEEIASTQKNLDFLDKENQKLADKRYEEQVKEYDRKPSSVVNSPVGSNSENFRQSRFANQAGAQLNDVVKSVNNQVNRQTNFIKLDVAPSDILSKIMEAKASEIDTVFVGKNKDELRFIKIPGQTNFIDVRLLDEDTLKELYKKLDISSSKIVESGKEAREKIDKIVEEAKSEGGRKVLFENLTSLIKTSVASGDKQLASMAANEILK